MNHKRKPKNAVRLLGIVGMERFLTLRDELGGRSIWIPKRGGGIWPHGMRDERDRCVRRWHQQGVASDTLASALKIKPGAISSIILSPKNKRSARRRARRTGAPT